MKPHPKIRKTVKWAGLVLTVLLAVTWAASAWWAVTKWKPGKWGMFQIVVRVDKGRVFFGDIEGVPTLGARVPPYIQFDRHELGLRFWFEYVAYKDLWYVSIPLWAFIVPAITATFAAWRLDEIAHRRACVGSCAKCGYDLSATPAALRCPECGPARMNPASP